MTFATRTPPAIVLTFSYWSGFALFDPAGVSWIARAVFYATCIAALLLVRRSAWAAAPSTVWLIRAAYCALLSVLFYGADQARDVLYGPQRLKAELPGWLGGLELWWVLCPGIVCVCLAVAADRGAAPTSGSSGGETPSTLHGQ